MGRTPNESLTRLLDTAEGGTETTTETELLTTLYGELRRMAGHMLRDERPGHTLQPTALLHEAWARMVDPEQLDQVDPETARRRFLSLAARSMRRVLIDHARRRARDKRGGGWQRVTLSGLGARRHEPGAIDVLDLDASLERLARQDGELAQLVELRFFAGLSIEATAELVGLSTATVERRWRAARAWLRRDLGRGAEGPPEPRG